MDIVRIILAIILPPVGVFLQVGFGVHFWVNILLTLLGYVPGIIHALYSYHKSEVSNRWIEASFKPSLPRSGVGKLSPRWPVSICETTALHVFDPLTVEDHGLAMGSNLSAKQAQITSARGFSN